MNIEIHAPAPDLEPTFEDKVTSVYQWYADRMKTAPWREQRTEEQLEKSVMTKERCIIRMNQVGGKRYSALGNFKRSNVCRQWVERHYQIQKQLAESAARKQARREAWEARNAVS